MIVTRKGVLKSHCNYQKDFEDVLNRIGCFDGTFLLQLKLASKPHQVPLRLLVYVLQKPLKEELKRLETQDIIAPLGS